MRHTKFTAGLMAFSISVAAYAAPARAGDEDVARAVGGLLTLFVVGKLIHESNKSSTPVAAPQPTHKPHNNKGHNGPSRHKAQPYSHFDIPAQCVVKVDRRHGADTSIAVERCLDKTRRSNAPLPKRCETDIRAKSGTVEGYDMSCLGRFGYKVADNRRH
ncbi:hypothetical protein [Celeribacter sp.]|uniref:hypothetical protein n=1 Tax=Celeribacter sp. TaxID=1890673 RepID=UPI003A9087A3